METSASLCFGSLALSDVVASAYGDEDRETDHEKGETFSCVQNSLDQWFPASQLVQILR